MGYMALAVGVHVTNPQDAVPHLILAVFPDWFVGFCFAAIAIGALVPAAIMSIGAANTFTRNIWKPFIHPAMSPQEEAVLAKLMSLIVKVGALAFILFVPTKFALDLQLLGGMWMAQVFPAVIFGLYTRWFNGWACLLAGPAAWCSAHGWPGRRPPGCRSTPSSVQALPSTTASRPSSPMYWSPSRFRSCCRIPRGTKRAPKIMPTYPKRRSPDNIISILSSAPTRRRSA